MLLWLRFKELQRFKSTLCVQVFSLECSFHFFVKEAKITYAEDRVSFRWQSASAAAIRLLNDAFPTRDQLQFCRSVMCCVELVLFVRNDPPCQSIFHITPKEPRVSSHMYSYVVLVVSYGLGIVAFIWSWCRRIM